MTTRTTTEIHPAATVVSIQRRNTGFYRLTVRPVGCKAQPYDLTRDEILSSALFLSVGAAQVALSHADAKARPVRLGVPLYLDRGRRLTPHAAGAVYNPGE